MMERDLRSIEFRAVEIRDERNVCIGLIQEGSDYRLSFRLNYTATETHDLDQLRYVVKEMEKIEAGWMENRA